MNNRVDETMLRRAIAEQVLPPAACVGPSRALPWPIGGLAMVGGWLASVPIVVWLFLAVPGMLEQTLPAMGIGAALLLSGIWLISRCRDWPLVVLAAVPVFFCGQLIVGTTLVFRQGEELALVAMAAVALVCAWRCENHALRVALGAQLAVLALFLFDFPGLRNPTESRWAALHLQLAAWCGLHAFRRSTLDTAQDGKYAALAESLSAGWIGAVVVGMAFASRPDWLLHTVTHGQLDVFLYGTRSWYVTAVAYYAISFTFAVVAACWLRAQWPGVRSIPAMLACCVLVVLAGIMPTLGGLLLILALSAGSARWRIATLAAVASVVTLVSFYQGWNWTLAMKALLLGALGAILLVAVMVDVRRRGTTVLAQPLPDKRRAWRAQLALPLASAVLMLVSVNWQIWQQEYLLARGRSVYFEIAPVDPRSLMQGDYMEMNFPALAPVALECRNQPACEVVLKLDKRGVVLSARRQGLSPPTADELAVRLEVRNGRLAPGSSDWFFTEGESQRWAKAKYAHFRILPNGRSALKQLYGAQLEKL